MTDERKLLKDKLEASWTVTVKPRPKFAVSQPVASHDLTISPVVAVYGISRNDTFQGIGANSKNIEVVLAIDIQARFDTDAITIRDELIRILDSIRKGGAVTGYDLITHDGGRNIEQQVGYDHSVIQVRMLKLYQAV